ncbi:MAG: hypothetical protein MI784_15035, partial [Cytophagales bacterium]|nr:hypothetical protein [Cytophagales bacterium]
MTRAFFSLTGILFMIFQFGFLPAFSGYRFKQSLRSVLKGEVVKDMVEDTNGFIILLTDKGLRSYDGHRIWKLEGRIEGVKPKAAIRRMSFQKNSNLIWLLAGEEAYIFDLTTRNFRSFFYENPRPEFIRGKIWKIFATDRGVYFIDSRRNITYWNAASGV